MFQSRRLVQVVLSTIILSINLSATQPQFAFAQDEDGIKRQVNAESGKVSFVGPESGRSLLAARALGVSSFARPADPAMALAKRFAPEFGLKNPERDLSVKESDEPQKGRLTVRYQQNYQGIPVMGGELMVNTNENGDLYSMNGEVSPDLSLSIEPTIDSEQAKQTALQAVAKWYQKNVENFLVSEPELWIYDESLLRASNRPIELVWRMEVTSVDNSTPLRELVLVNAARGNISLHFNQIDTAWHSHSGNSSFRQAPYSNKPIADTVALKNPILLTFSPLVNTYTANSTSSLPGSFLCDQSQPNCTNGSNPHADAAHKYAIGTFNLYDIQHGRNSIDNSGMTIISTVHYCDDSDPFSQCPYDNAFWSGAQMVYGAGSGWPLGDDAVAHEFTHGVTQYESNLFYFYQSGAINESFSDLWGEYYDQTNTQGTDTASVKWQIGEDVSGLGTFRDMSDPTVFGHPDKMTSPLYYTDGFDNGGVHYNSGINNKAVFLMVDGGTFNGKTVTALGWVKTTAIYYEAQTNILISGSDYSDLYYALQQACSNLIGQKGITAGNCTEVKDAIDAVEMNSQPIPNFNTHAPICGSQQAVNTIFFDNLESGTSNWSFTTTGADPRWQYDSPYGTYAHSGLHSLYADDYPGSVTDATARLISMVVPNNAYLHFAQAYGFEVDFFFGDYYDGGVLEYSTNNGINWVDAGSLIDYNGYKGTIFTGASNPLSGRLAFVGDSHGYISTRLNLASLAGNTVTFRWRMGLDQAVSAWGWWVDDVRIYNCTSTISGNVGAAGVTLSYTDGTAKTAISQTDGSYSLTVSDHWSGTVTPTHDCYTFTPTHLSYSNVTTNKTGQNYTASFNSASGCAEIDVEIGGNNVGSYGIPTQGSLRVTYPLDDGPVKVASTNSLNIIAALRNAWSQNGIVQSWAQLMGLPDTQLSTTYYFPAYNNVTLSDQLRFANLGNAQTTVTVKIGNVINQNYVLQAGESLRVSYSGVDSGPVTVSSNGQLIIAALREAWSQNGIVESWSQLMGLPSSQLSTAYYFPAYNNVTLSDQLRFANLGNAQTTVTVKIGSVVNQSYVLQAGESLRVSYPGVDSGPVTVSSDGEYIIAALRNAWSQNGIVESWVQLMGLPDTELSDTYYFPAYNNVTLSDQLRFANLGNAQTTVTVKIGSVVNQSYVLQAGESLRVSYPGVDSGPVTVSSDGQLIIAAVRNAWSQNGIVESWAQLMGLPASQLSDIYYFPAYNNVTLSDQLRIAVP